MDLPKKKDEPPRDVWVVSNGYGECEFADINYDICNDHANDACADRPHDGPFRLCKYTAILSKK